MAWARRVARRAGRPALARPRTRTERLFPLAWLAWLLAPILAALAPEPCALGCLWEPGSGWPRAAGLALHASGLALAALGSWTLGASWRIGVDEEAPGPLVTRGVYALTRNPVFGGMLLALLGLLAWVPALPLAALWLATAALARAQVAREEAFLASRFGEGYARYAARTGRWGPRAWRWRRTGDGPS